ncbi:uncharacterized protein LOC120565391 isoform X3 [Perca fluviatilis]|uniref:uncharacterized protein LOC120565391 isoform X3 n=1 Tax=Perca fluviatilis TaxID=8168 RepID=UPI0019642C1E|nr:uncharacterized protein LOC120565391 isoform X3 [Perca fluviatilis]
MLSDMAVFDGAFGSFPHTEAGDRERMDCYSSDDINAMKATLVFDDNNDDGNLWTRTSQDAPLPLCSSSHPPDSSCLVCTNQTVFVVCRNLTKGVKVMMEAGTDQVLLSKSECPDPPSVDAPQSLLAVIIPFILLILIIGGVFCRKRCRKRRNKPQTHTKEESSTMTGMAP